MLCCFHRSMQAGILSDGPKVIFSVLLHLSQILIGQILRPDSTMLVRNIATEVPVTSPKATQGSFFLLLLALTFRSGEITCLSEYSFQRCVHLVMNTLHGE